MTREKILITGGCGAIGSQLVKSLLAKNLSSITVLDNMSSGSKLEDDPYLKTINLDIADSEKMASFFESYEPDVIYHLAAHFANQNSVDHPVSDVQTNIIGMINLFECQKHNNKLKKIVYCSSSCVYGDQTVMKESDSVIPFETPYAINKYVGELYCKYYNSMYQIPVVSLRIFNSFGPGEASGLYRNVIPNFIRRALNGQELVITGSGDETRDFCYVDNTVDLLQLACSSKYRNSEVFNGGSGVETKIIDVAKLIIKATNSKSQISYVSARSWDHVKKRKANIDLACSKLNYKPYIDLESQIKKTVEWALDNDGH